MVGLQPRYPSLPYDHRHLGRPGAIPAGLVSANAVRWRDHIVIPGGEVSPTVGTNRVYRVEPVTVKPEFGSLNTGILVLYLLSLVAMGVYFSPREKPPTTSSSAGSACPGGRPA